MNVKDTLEFVRNFILVNSLSSSGIIKDSDITLEKHNKMILKSLRNLLGFLKSVEGLKIEFNIMKQAVSEIHKLFDVPFGKQNMELMNACLDFLDELLFEIHKTLEINKVRINFCPDMGCLDKRLRFSLVTIGPIKIFFEHIILLRL